MVFTSVVLGLFHTMPYSWFSQKCSLSVQLFSQTIYMYVTCSFGIFDTNGLQLDFTSTKCSIGIVDTTAYSWCTESWVWEALPLAGMFGGLVRVKKVRSREFCRLDTSFYTKVLRSLLTSLPLLSLYAGSPRDAVDISSYQW